MSQIIATPNQSFLCKAMEFRIAAAVAVLLQDLGYNVAMHATAYKTSPGQACFYPTGWRKGNQDFDLRPSGSRKASTVGLHFENARWDSSGNCKLVYGPTTLDHKVVENNDAKTKIIKNETDDELHVSYEESEELTNSFSSSVTKGVTLDMTKTKDKSLDVGAKISGSYAGVEAEASMAAHMGVSESESESRSSELGKEKAEEGTKSESIAIEFDAKARSNYLLSITKENEQTRQPFDINSVMDFDINVHAKDEYWQNTINSGHSPHGKINLMGIEGLVQFVLGYDTDYPAMLNYWHKAPSHVKDAMEWLQEPENRRIQVSGINLANLDKNADYDVKLLGSSVPSDLSHLPVVDAQDVAA